MPPDSESSPTRSRWVWVLAGFAVSLFFLFGWFDQSMESAMSVAAPSRLVIVSDAGRVELSSVEEGEAVQIEWRDSWLFSEPRIETAESNGEFVVRLTCPGRFPCRSDLSAAVPEGTDVVVLATDGVVDVRGHVGSLLVLSQSPDGVLLGPVAGSARIFSSHGSVNGFHLALDDLELVVEQSPVRLDFSEPPTAVQVTAADDLVQIGLPQRFYRVGIDTASPSVVVDVNQSINSDRGIDVQSEGPVRVVVSDQ